MAEEHYKGRAPEVSIKHYPTNNWNVVIECQPLILTLFQLNTIQRITETILFGNYADATAVSIKHYPTNNWNRYFDKYMEEVY